VNELIGDQRLENSKCIRNKFKGEGRKLFQFGFSGTGIRNQSLGCYLENPLPIDLLTS